MTLHTGQTLQDRYRIASMLGQGGMGAVYRAWDTRLNIPVALKEMVPQPGLDAQMLTQLRDQFRQEAGVLARLSHPHLVRVTDFFEEGGNAYLVMDFVDGESMAERIKEQGCLGEGQVLAWAAQLLSALEYCHSQGIIHRDVKPQNVIIRPDGKAVLVDFGLVKLWDPQDPHTRTAMRGMGTPEYAPPEQYESGAGHTDPRSDVYSMGALMYHALAGTTPPPATLRMADPDRFRPLQAIAPNVSERTAGVVMKALALARSQRWQSAAEMAAALQGRVVQVVAPPRGAALADSQPAMAAPPAAVSRPITGPVAAAPAARRRSRWWLWVAGGLLLLLCLMVGFGGGVALLTALSPTATPWVTATPWPTTMPMPIGTVALDHERNPTFGTVSLVGGFAADPHTVSVVSGGSINAQDSLGSSCRGYVSAAPTVRLEWSGTASRLRVFFVANDYGDATLVIRDPQGQWFCNDDSPYGTLNPLIELTSLQPGRYAIWVGSYSSGISLPGTVYFTESELHPGNLSGDVETPVGSLDYTLTPNYGSARLGTGFAPDPYTVDMVSGGSVDVSRLGLGLTCGGYATGAPDFVVDWSGNVARLRIFFVADESGRDTRLVVRGPGGEWLCNDDFANLNPLVDITNPQAGQITIWVASYMQDSFIQGTLYITTQEYDPAHLP